MSPQAREAVDAFHQIFGQKALLAAQALASGYSREMVHEAWAGEGFDARLASIRCLHGELRQALHTLRYLNVDMNAVLARTRLVKQALQQEYEVTLPLSR